MRRISLPILILSTLLVLAMRPQRISGGSVPTPGTQPQEIVDISAPTFTTFDVTGAGTSALQGTGGLSINSAGIIAGSYIVAGNVTHGFVRAANGAITPFNAPGAGTGNNQGTFPSASTRQG